MKKLVGGITLMFVMAASVEAIACSCLPFGTVLEELEEADAVFLGRVLAVHDNQATGRRLARVRVVESWKGVSTGLVTVETPISGAECGYPLESGENHVFYVNRHGGNRLHLSLCSRTMPLHTADGLGDIETLRRTRR